MANDETNKKLPRIYTRGGDQGLTQLIGAGRQSKDHQRIVAYGTVDEAGAVIGVALSHLRPDTRYADLVHDLDAVQQRLWDVGADLARIHDEIHPYRTDESAAGDLEPIIDRYQAELPPVRQFIVRGGNPAGAMLHLACTVVRRAEREIVRVGRRTTIHAPVLRYLNRLSDLLFVMARVANVRAGIPEVPDAHSAHVFH